MQYMLLIYSERANAPSEAERQKCYEESAEYRAEAQRATGNSWPRLRSTRTSTATSVRVRDGKRLVTDGPFAETREQLGGYYLIEAKDLDEAIGIAAEDSGRALGHGGNPAGDEDSRSAGRFQLATRRFGARSFGEIIYEQGANDEQSAGIGGHAQGRVHPDVGREARKVGRQRSAFRGLGDLSSQRIAGRSESAVCVAVQRLVRAADPALRRRRQNVGAGRQQVRLRRRSRARTSGTTARRIPGSSSASGISNPR